MTKQQAMDELDRMQGELRADFIGTGSVEATCREEELAWVAYTLSHAPNKVAMMRTLRRHEAELIESLGTKDAWWLKGLREGISVAEQVEDF